MGATDRASAGDGLNAAGGPRALWPFALILAAYVGWRIAGFAGVTTVAYRDTESYLEVARSSLLSTDFWAGGRAWTLPLLYKLLPDSDAARAVGQFVLSLVCWSALATAVARSVRPTRYRLVAFAVVLLFSLSFSVIRWDRLMLSESVSISLTVAVCAAWLELVRAPRRGMVLVVLGVSLLWVFTRDSNGLLALVTGLAAAVLIVRPGALGRGWAALLSGGLVAIFALNVAASSTQAAELRRNERPMLHVVGRRVLVNPTQQAFFERRGMPRPPPRVVRFRKQLAALGHGIPSDPASDRFLEWVRAHGRATLARWLITHPGATLGPLVKYRRRLLGGVTQGYRAPDARPVLPGPVESLVYPRRVGGVLRWLVLAVAGALAVALVAGGRRSWLVPAALIALQLPHAVLVYHGDTLEIPRHAILVAVSLRLGILLLALLVIDRALEALARRRAGAPSGAAPSAASAAAGRAAG